MLVSFATGMRGCSQTRLYTRLKSGLNSKGDFTCRQTKPSVKLKTVRNNPTTTTTSKNTDRNLPSVITSRKTKPVMMDTNKLLAQLTSGALDLESLSKRSGGAEVLQKYRETRLMLGYFIGELYEEGRHEDMAVAVKVLRDANYNVKGGISTTLLKSFLECGMWREAVALVQEMQWDDVKGERCGLANLRLYNDLVSQAADDDHINLAFYYFRETRKDEIAKISKFHRRAIRPLNEGSLVSLLDCLIRASTRRTSYSDVGDNNPLELPPFDSKVVLDEILVYLQNWRFPISQNLLERIATLSKVIECYDITLTIEKQNACAHCQHILAETSDFNELCKKMVSNLELYMEEHSLVENTKLFESLFRQHGYFDLLIDGGNMMGFLHNNPKAMSGFLSAVAKFPAEKPVFVASSHLVEFLPNIESLLSEYGIFLAEVPVHEHFNDDLSLLYLASKSESETQINANIVSHDKFGDHRFIAQGNHREYTHWMAERQFHYDVRTGCLIAANQSRHSVTNSNGSKGDKQRIPPIQSVFFHHNGHFHLRAENGRVCCLSPKMENESGSIL